MFTCIVLYVTFYRCINWIYIRMKYRIFSNGIVLDNGFTWTEHTYAHKRTHHTHLQFRKINGKYCANLMSHFKLSDDGKRTNNRNKHTWYSSTASIPKRFCDRAKWFWWNVYDNIEESGTWTRWRRWKKILGEWDFTALDIISFKSH